MTIFYLPGMSPHVIAIATLDRANIVPVIPINTIIPPHITTRRLPKTEARTPATGPTCTIKWQIKYNVSDDYSNTDLKGIKFPWIHINTALSVLTKFTHFKQFNFRPLCEHKKWKMYLDIKEILHSGL